MIEFPVSGIETYWWLPISVAFVISSLTSMAGVSGAFLLLPFQISILGFTGPAVSSTNLVYNIVAIPSGVYRYYHEKRMVWPIVGVIVLATLPGVFLGALIRVNYLPDPSTFKIFAGLVLLYIGIRLFVNIFNKREVVTGRDRQKDRFNVTGTYFNIKQLGYEFNNMTYGASTPGLMVLSFTVGIIGGTYGIGGGAIIAPFLVAVFRLPVHTIAGPALLSTFVTSVAGVLFYSIIAPYYKNTGLTIAPDWMLGLLFGIGGAIGMYIGARMQKFVPAVVIKSILAVIILLVAAKYILGGFLG